jgi:hypothetical protein
MKEIWKDIIGYEGKYQVSNKGNIKSLNYNNTKQERVLKPKVNKQGNLEVTLNKNDKHHYCMVNRLVIETFSNTKLNKNDIVMYKDNDKTNCSIDNMYLITRGKRQELTYDEHKRNRYKYEFYGEIKPIKEISKITGIKPRNIRDRMRMLNWNIYEAGEIPVGRRS